MGCKDIGIRKSEFVTNTQFLYLLGAPTTSVVGLTRKPEVDAFLHVVGLDSDPFPTKVSC